MQTHSPGPSLWSTTHSSPWLEPTRLSPGDGGGEELAELLGEEFAARMIVRREREKDRKKRREDEKKGEKNGRKKKWRRERKARLVRKGRKDRDPPPHSPTV